MNSNMQADQNNYISKNRTIDYHLFKLADGNAVWRIYNATGGRKMWDFNLPFTPLF